MTASATIGQCTSCREGPRVLDPDTSACSACLTRHRNLVEFFRQIRFDPNFKLYARRNLNPSKRETFDAMFGTGERPPAHTGAVGLSELLLEDDDEEDGAR